MRDFHQHQHTARGQSHYLLVLLAVSLTTLLVVSACLVSNAVFALRRFAFESNAPVFDPVVMLITAALQLIVIGLGCAWKAQQLQRGGRYRRC